MKAGELIKYLQTIGDDVPIVFVFKPFGSVAIVGEVARAEYEIYLDGSRVVLYGAKEAPKP